MKTLSPHAATAKAIRAELKRAYPSVSFTVRARSFAGGDAVDIEWTDGPTSRQVQAISGKYEYGHFDGMIDLYEVSNRRDDIPQVKYVQERRETSRAVYAAAVETVNCRFGWAMELHPDYASVTSESDKHTGHGWQSQEINRLLWDLSLLCPSCAAPILPGDAYCPACGSPIVTLITDSE